MNDTIRGLLAKHGNLPVAVTDVADAADLYDAGLSSFASVQVMLALEEEFDIEFPEHLLNRKSFSSIEAIEGAVSEILEEQAA
ncbi:acyl carrier protein [Roseibium denhamense]|uniref:Phosphopantetheine attachment site n=1 Tax=Roseibium denhamense TaxID=76305 RepID=A0ABY1PKT1_9HYPH|nr:acyl carrier protein [Roseibium denhamense]MTI05554.1 acyl carrier protein [Roseibium denhamense]SMP34965.1 Phosphopantetheine attachment site [Roseibium denhamense]